jgi:hypothetical protein
MRRASRQLNRRDRKWVHAQIGIALAYGKPIVATSGNGPQGTPRAVKAIADEVVGWDAPRLLDAIHRLSL